MSIAVGVKVTVGSEKRKTFNQDKFIAIFLKLNFEVGTVTVFGT